MHEVTYLGNIFVGEPTILVFCALPTLLAMVFLRSEMTVKLEQKMKLDFLEANVIFMSQ